VRHRQPDADLRHLVLALPVRVPVVAEQRTQRAERQQLPLQPRLAAQPQRAPPRRLPVPDRQNNVPDTRALGARHVSHQQSCLRMARLMDLTELEDGENLTTQL
jgi:hypothetical protein